MILLQNGQELKGCEGPAHIRFCEVSVQPAEYPGVIAADKEDLIALQFRVAVEAAGQHLCRGDQDVECIGEQCDRWEKLDFHKGEFGALEI